MNDPKMKPVHDDVRGLLPWYLNGTLEEAEASLVRAHLEDCSECRADLAVHENMRVAVTQDEATPILPAVTANSLLDRLEHPALRPDSRLHLKKYAVAASILIAVLAATATVTKMTLPFAENRTYQTATSTPESSRIGYVLRLQFEEGISPETMDQILAELGGLNIRRLENSEEYEMLVHLPNSSLDDLEGFASEAQSRAEVKSAEFVALQVPVR